MAATDDQHAFEHRRQVFGLGVAVGVARVGGLQRDVQRPDGRERGRDVDDAFRARPTAARRCPSPARRRTSPRAPRALTATLPRASFCVMIMRPFRPSRCRPTSMDAACEARTRRAPRGRRPIDHRLPEAICARKIIIDTDPGQDDAVAILLALASPGDSTCSGSWRWRGNVPLRPHARGMRAGSWSWPGAPDVPVYAGCGAADGAPAGHGRARPRPDRARRRRPARARRAAAAAARRRLHRRDAAAPPSPAR